MDYNYYKEATLAFADGRFDALAKEMAGQMKAMPAVGIYGDDVRRRTLWGEYRLEAKRDSGGILKWAWNETLRQILTLMVNALPPAEPRLLSLFTEPCQDLMLKAEEEYEEACKEAKEYGNPLPDPANFLTIPADDDWLEAEILGRLWQLAEVDNLATEELVCVYEEDDADKRAARRVSARQRQD